MANTEEKTPYTILNRSFGRGDCLNTKTGQLVNTSRIYELEDVITRAIQNACEWRAKNFGENMWRESVPSELLFVLCAFERNAAYLAARSFVEEYEGRHDPDLGGQSYDPDALQAVMPDAESLHNEVRERIAQHATELHLTPADIKALQREFQCLKVSTRAFVDICTVVYEKATKKTWSSPFQGRGRTNRLAGWTLAGIMRKQEDPYKYAMDNNG